MGDGSLLSSLTETQSPINADPNAVAATSMQGAVAGVDNEPSLFQSIWQGAKDAGGALVAGVKTDDNSMLGAALGAAKSKILQITADKLAARPDVQQAAKDTAGAKIGAFFMQYWYLFAIGAAALGYYLIKKGGK